MTEFSDNHFSFWVNETVTQNDELQIRLRDTYAILWYINCYEGKLTPDFCPKYGS